MTEECYTFDAILMVIEAAKSEQCKDEIGRACIAEALDKKNHFNIGCGEYLFANGESETASYRVFTGCTEKTSQKTGNDILCRAE